MKRVVVLTVVGMLVAGCSSGPELAAEEKILRDLDTRWQKAFQAKDAAGEAVVFAEDGIAYRENVDPLVGPAAYQAYATKFYADNPKFSGSWTIDSFRLAESGDLAIQTGEYQLTAMGPNGDGEARGRYVTTWKKVNGEWKVSHDAPLPPIQPPATEQEILKLGRLLMRRS